MVRSIRRLAASVLVGALITLAASQATAGNYYKYYEYDDDPAGVIADTLVLRPLAIIAFAMGIGMFIPAAAVTTIVGQPQNIDKPFEAFVLKPGKWVFVDPIATH
jgi:hypothetical protein